MAGVEVAENRNLKKNGNDDAFKFASSLMEQVNREDITSMVYIQRDMLSRFEKTNEMLINFNILSASRYEATVKDFQKHTQLLFDMKKDLDTVFKRIRGLKQRLEKSYPDAFAACSSVYTVISDSDEDSGADDDDSDEIDPASLFQEGRLEARSREEPTDNFSTPDPPLVTVTDIGSPTGNTPKT